MIQVNADLQRTAQREKAFVNEQCIKLEENNRRGKTRDLFRKIGNLKGPFHPKMDTIQAGNDRAPVDAKEIKQRWKGYMYKNNLNEPDDCDDMVSQREPDMREREIK